MTNPGPGWYVDPEDVGLVRWWSGHGWTEHRSAAAPAQGQDQPEPVNDVPAIDYASNSDFPSTIEYVPMARGAQSDVGAGKLTRKEKDRQLRRNNSFAYLGCVFALVGFLINPFAIFSILGVIFSAIGLAKANELEAKARVTGRGTALAGVIIGVIGICLFAWTLYQRTVA